MIIIALDFSLSTHYHTSTTGFISLTNTLYTIYISTSREIRSFNILHQTIEIYIRIINISTATINDLTEIMSRNISSHTNGNTISTIYQQIRNFSRHHTWFLQCIIEVIRHVYSILIKVIHDMLTHLAQTTLGITHSSRRVTIHRTKVTLAINQKITHIPVLAHTNEGAINRRVTMWVILTKNLTYYTGTFLIGIIASITNTKHTIKDTTMNRFEAISYIRERTSHNNRHRIVDI